MCNQCLRWGCQNIGEISIPLPKRGGRNGYICDYHAHHNDSYYTKNTLVYGKPKANGFTYSIELEVSSHDIQTRGELFDIGFIATSDCTVECEFKSPIYQGLNAPVAAMDTIQTLIDNDHVTIGSNCGTHFHVGQRDYINAETMGYIRRFYHSLFVPLCEAMQADSEKTSRFFGRELGGWAASIYAGCDVMNHKNFVNMQHDETIEFRICKLSDGKQYAAVMNFCKQVVSTVIENFVKHFNDEEIDSTRYKNITAYRKHKAQVTAQKIIKLWEKL